LHKENKGGESLESDVLVKLQKWAKSAGLTPEELYGKYKENYTLMQSLHPGKAENFYKDRALFMVYRDIKSARLVRAKPVDGLFIGFNVAFDVTTPIRNYALEVFRTNMEKAIREGYTDESGNPLDNRPQTGYGTKNPNFGKPLVPAFLRNSYFIGRPADSKDLKLGVLTQIGEVALKRPPLGQPVRFLANQRADEPYRRLYNSSIRTEFDLIEMPEFEKGGDEVVCEWLGKTPDPIKTTLSGLPEWHARNQADVRRLCIIEADVLYIRREPLATGNFLMVVEDETTMDMDVEGTTVFVHHEIKEQLNFGSGSKIYLVGQSGTGPGYDRTSGAVDRTITRYIVNAVGVWAIPEFRVPPEEEILLEPSEEVEP